MGLIIHLVYSIDE